MTFFRQGYRGLGTGYRVAVWILLGACTQDAPRSIMTADGGGVPEGDSAVVVEDAGAPPADAGAQAEDAGTAGTVAFSEVFASVFYPRCSGCHNGAALSPTPVIGDRSTLVDVESDDLAGVILVVPGDAEASFLYRKVEGTHAEVCVERGMAATECGLRMPRGSPMPPPLTDEELAMVRAWIEGGARP